MTEGHPPLPGRGRRWARRVAFWTGLALLSLLGALAAVVYVGPRTYHWKAFDVQIALRPARHGQTRLILPPLGEVHAATHAPPVALDLSLTGVSVEKIAALAARHPRRALLEQEFTRAARTDLTNFALWQVVCGALGGLLAPLLLRPRRWVPWLGGALVGGGAVAALLLWTYHTFDRGAFDRLTYTGSLRQSTAVLAFARTAFDNAERLADRLRGAAADLNTLYGRLDALPALAPGTPTVRVLHISDFHNNAAAVGFVQELAARFQVDAVINTGDLTDFGSPVESRLSHGLAALPVPTLFVAGNHDSQATVRAEQAKANTTVLNGQLVTVAGLRVLGEPDPSSRRAGVGSVDTSDTALTDAAARLAADVGRLPSPPDIVCVHNPRQAADVIGKVPLVLCGHTHTASLQTQGVTVVCNAGTTGGAGTRYFDRPDGVPLTAAVLTFTRAPRPRLVSIDQVALSGALNEYSITRHVFPGPASSTGP